ncbi:hypothetical protein GCM10023232_16670 [Sphingosinicella ginsenosidimutans]
MRSRAVAEERGRRAEVPQNSAALARAQDAKALTVEENDKPILSEWRFRSILRKKWRRAGAESDAIQELHN